ncbi:acyltransferase [Roseomonas sp. 1311]|uniref:Acyltransferase n=1 Tax=Roseomonas marmotae TaxID=2768161 RepID=A0ABS3KGK6_9PROT|nr:acyltransferase [Roseomonas marmotae]
MSGIEAGRGLAAVLVILYHAVRHLDQATEVPLLKMMLQFGHAGVDFFFVISGFIICFVHGADIGRPARIEHYVRQRFTRLMPVYWIATALTLAAIALTGRALPSVDAILWSITLLPLDYEAVLGIAWTLQHEMLFYAVFGILILNLKAGLVLLAAWLSVVVTSLTGADTGLPRTVVESYNLQFLFGMAAALILRSGPVRSPRLLLTAGIALFGMAGMLENVEVLDGYSTAARFAYGVPSALILIGLVEMERLNALRVPAVLQILGASSYSLYLFHILCIGVAWQVLAATALNQMLPPFLLLLLLALSGILGGVVISFAVERPLIRLLRQGRDRAAPASAGRMWRRWGGA